MCLLTRGKKKSTDVMQKRADQNVDSHSLVLPFYSEINFDKLTKITYYTDFPNQTMGVSVPLIVSGVLFRCSDFFMGNLPLV